MHKTQIQQLFCTHKDGHLRARSFCHISKAVEVGRQLPPPQWAMKGCRQTLNHQLTYQYFCLLHHLWGLSMKRTAKTMLLILHFGKVLWLFIWTWPICRLTNIIALISACHSYISLYWYELKWWKQNKIQTLDFSLLALSRLNLTVCAHCIIAYVTIKLTFKYSICNGFCAYKCWFFIKYKV